MAQYLHNQGFDHVVHQCHVPQWYDQRLHKQTKVYTIIT